MDEEIRSLLVKVQQRPNHQKYLKIIESYYHKMQVEDFIYTLFKNLKAIFCVEIGNPYIENVLDFLAQFVSVLTKSNNDLEVSHDDNSSHIFLTRIINETLKFHNLALVTARYFCCRFMTLILQHIGSDMQLDNEVCDYVQEIMLECTTDPKVSVRLQAVMALVRLQDPFNMECPVIKAYLYLLTDANPSVREEVLKNIAPNATTLLTISERIRDVDVHVRTAAYIRCANIGPKFFKIVTRQQILKCGLYDESKQVKKVMTEVLLPKWLSEYDGNFITLLNALKLDADENDIQNTEEISKQVMKVFFKITPIEDIIQALPIENDEVLSLNNLSSEVVAYWNIVTNFLRSSDEMEQFLNRILPELTPFCNFIERIIESMPIKKMEEWEYLDYQYMLYNLFDMAEQYDFSDEVGRKKLLELVMSILSNLRMQSKLTKKVVSIAHKLTVDAKNKNINQFTETMCEIISDIREPFVEKLIDKQQICDKEFQVAELKVKINVLQGNIEDAIDTQEFESAKKFQTELLMYRKKLEELTNKTFETVKVKVAKNDTDTICRCLDILNAMLELPSINVLSPSLKVCKEEFVVPLLMSSAVEINWRVLKCLGLLSVIDNDTAKDNIRILCIPIITYRAIPNYNKCVLIQSISIICDLIRIYGVELFNGTEDTDNSTTQQNTTRRRLFQNEDTSDISILDHRKMNVEFIIEIILDMLDDENEEIRDMAVTVMAKLILNDFPVIPLVITRILLKWFNPLTEKPVDRIQQKLGYIISCYATSIKGSRETIEKAVIPTLRSIAKAPRSSPLADINIDNVVRFLAAITNSSDMKSVTHIHTNLAHTLCYKIAANIKDPVAPYLSKMLVYLEIPSENSIAIKELITQVEIILNESEDKLERNIWKNVTKFVEKLKASTSNESVEKRKSNQDQSNETILTAIIEESNSVGDSTRESEKSVDKEPDFMHNSKKKRKRHRRRRKSSKDSEDNNNVEDSPSSREITPKKQRMNLNIEQMENNVENAEILEELIVELNETVKSTLVPIIEDSNSIEGSIQEMERNVEMVTEDTQNSKQKRKRHHRSRTTSKDSEDNNKMEDNASLREIIPKKQKTNLIVEETESNEKNVEILKELTVKLNKNAIEEQKRKVRNIEVGPSLNKKKKKRCNKNDDPRRSRRLSSKVMEHGKNY